MIQIKATGDVPDAGHMVAERASVVEDTSLAANTTTAREMEDELKKTYATKGFNRRMPWYKTPSVWWILPITVVSKIITASTIAPHTELFIKFACDDLRPEYGIDTNTVQWRPGPRDTQTNVSLTFVQNHPILDNHVMKSMLLHPDQRCFQDPAVHGAVAKLSARITSAEGIFSCLTLGWWTQYSDRAGRTKVLAITAFTMLLADALFFLVAFNAAILPGGYQILILGGVIRGLSGGLSACWAAGYAYIADCTSPSARSQIFSFWVGCIHVGSALGPSLGSLLNSYSNDLLSTFYISLVMHIIYAIFMVFIVPESLSDETRTKAEELYKADIHVPSETILGSLWRLTSFTRMLSVFVPRRLPEGRGHRRYRDWNLTLIGVAAAAVAINIGQHHFKYQYTIKTFHWSSVQLGYWLSLVGFWHALYLSVILPAILKALYAREERLSNGSGSDDEKEGQVKKIDLLVVRASLLIDLVSYILLGIVTSQAPFIGATIFLTFGEGFAPSVQSLALALSNPSAHIARREARAHGTTMPSSAKQEIGRLFGALAVIHSLGAQVVGPALFGTTFGATVGVYPRAIFWLCVIIVVLALGALGAVRLDAEAVGEDSEHEPLFA
ncbi:unnamed protein product [Rhizoctonia solani]|uniref:Major facilitator superfamily (MFS) profile domain-containing protein n=1 Tax=Rhizoctonia solani TaxID=456999 RepID=A0A8H2XW42_9AGAM|nr:unnamed protein product [Rhizoctonia solani]